MLKDIIWANDRCYRVGSDHEPLEFYLECLCNSNKLDLLLGYFSSSAINVLSLGFATFLYRGGKLRMVINDILSLEDKNAIEAANRGEVVGGPIDLKDIVGLRERLDNYGKHFFECLAWLISNDTIQLKIVRPKFGRGISHYKSGVFSDDANSVGFKGSCNFTAFGLIQNLEELDASLSWENGSSRWVEGQNEYFEKIFSKQSDFVEYLNIEDVNIAIQSEFGDKSLNELLINEKELLGIKKSAEMKITLQRTIDNAIKKIELIKNEPKFPFPEGPRNYQIAAYENWVKNGYSGIFAMATGTGKTITSLNCVLQELSNVPDRNYHVLVLVPTLTLLDQWEKELSSFNMQNIFKISSKYDWKSEVTTMLSTAKRISISFSIICTYASFAKNQFQNLLSQFPDDTVLIADEAHNLAASNCISKLKNVHITKRIGLSATPKRIYDPEGSKILEEFFNDEEPYTFSFTLEKAIKEGILCEYYYYPHIVNLTEDEMKEYVEISKKLAKLFNISNGDVEGNNGYEILLQTRKRIIHKAFSKLGMAFSILNGIFEKKGNLKYTFVYVPEGRSTEVSEYDDGQDDDELRIIDKYTSEIARISQSVLVNRFISGQKDRNEILNQFQEGIIDVIASMKCLDEGIDIPRAETALFCSSTGNPRQFIQRRGRILRKHPEKPFATIHDLVVVPSFQNTEDSDTYNLEKSLVTKELERVMYFASVSRNPFHTEDIFSEVCKYYSLNIYAIQTQLKPI